VRTAQQAAALLVRGPLERAVWPEFADEAFVAEVHRRLGEVNAELASSGRHLVARATELPAEGGFEPVFRLNTVELAMVAALYLYLRYEPRQRAANGVEVDADPSVEVEDIVRAFPSRSRDYLQKVLTRLKRMGFVRRDHDRLFAGPYLAALDDVAADARADQLLERFLRRRYLRRVDDEEAADDDAG
jgi:hypothetical protein